uniref:RING-type domain-containing protein n=1 Tax=Meloidogyne javanica TaxID=6303 RepID=A0A915MA49_MELJA
MNWIHCNKCSSVPATGKCFFWLTSCGHVFCGECAGIEKGSIVHGTTNSVSCFVCHHNVKAVQIRRGMDQSAAVLFRPPNELLQKLSQFYKIGEIIKFQAWQFASFQRLRQGKDTSQEVYYKQLLQKKDRDLEKALEENKRLNTLLESKEKEIRQLSQQQKE